MAISKPLEDYDLRHEDTWLMHRGYALEQTKSGIYSIKDRPLGRQPPLVGAGGFELRVTESKFGSTALKRAPPAMLMRTQRGHDLFKAEVRYR